MFYTKAHVRALEAQIADLKGRNATLEARLVEVYGEVRTLSPRVAALEPYVADLKARNAALEGRLAEEQKATPQVLALESQIVHLKTELDRERDERRDMLDRVLAKNNVEPVHAKPEKPADVIEMAHPWGAAIPAIEDGLKASFMAEEVAYQISQGHSQERAEQLAEAEYVKRHRVLQ